MLKRRYRLTSNAQIVKVNRSGQSWHNRWLVLVKHANSHPESRFAFSVSRRIGKAVVRNRIKRLLRETIRRRLHTISAGWDVLLIARAPSREARFEQIDYAVADLLRRSHLQIEDSTTMPSSRGTLGQCKITPGQNVSIG